MSIIHGRNPEGESVTGTNPVLIGAKDINGKSILLTTDADGKLQVATDLQVTATDVTIHDSTTPENKLKINTDGSVNTQLSGSNITDGLMVRNNGKVVVDTIINAVTVNAGETTESASLDITNETEVWVAINIDKQPWSAYCNRPVYLKGVGSDTSLFPKRRSVSAAYPTMYSPCYSFFMGLPVVTASGLAEPATLAEAKLYNCPYQGANILIKNEHATEAATVTVKVIRIWR